MIKSENSNLLYADASLCVGCRLCEYACSLAKEKLFIPNLSRIKIMKLEEKGLDVPIVCIHENPAPCELACPNDAMVIDEKTGVVSIILEKCTLCMCCKEACPYDIIIFDKKRKRVLKCDFCSGTPACVKICPTGALKTLSHINRNSTNQSSALQEPKTKRKE